MNRDEHGATSVLWALVPAVAFIVLAYASWAVGR